MRKTTPWHRQLTHLDDRAPILEGIVEDPIYHNHSECNVGAPIPTKHRVDGTGDLKQCPVCRDLSLATA
jgi:hypothetical protein